MSANLVSYLERALLRRRILIENSKTNFTTAYRLFGGGPEGIPGLVVERFAELAILQFHAGECRLSPGELEAVGQWYLKELGLKAVYLKEFISDRSQKTAAEALYSPIPLVGSECESVLEIREEGLAFEIRPYDGFSTGIFLDQRRHRSYLGRLARGKRVLNCFSYTCAFSVACAANDAEVDSVDLSKKYLEWGKRNFVLNGLDLAKHRFFASDVFDFFKRAEKRAEKYDLVIVDPPSFSRNHLGQIFSVNRDLRKLMAGAVARVKPGGLLFFSSNYASWSSAHLARCAETVTSEHKKRRFEKLPEAPEDFQDDANPLSAILLRL